MADLLEIGAKVPDFTLDDIDGNPYNLRDNLRRGPVVLAFYRGGWCAGSNRYLRSAQRAYPDFKEIGVEIVAISTDKQDSVAAMRKKRGLTMKLLGDTGGAVARQYHCIWSKDGDFNEPALFLVRDDGALLFESLVSTAVGLAPIKDVLGHAQWRDENGTLKASAQKAA